MRQSFIAGAALLIGLLAASGSVHAQRATARPVMRPVAENTTTTPTPTLAATTTQAPIRDAAATPPARQ
jgi:hypothetical protein